MRILKCDICKKIIKDDPVRADVGFRVHVELCHKCGLPVLKLLKLVGVEVLDASKRLSQELLNSAEIIG